MTTLRFSLLISSLAILSLSSIIVTSQYEPPTATVVPFHPRGIRFSIPDEQGISLVAFHIKINQDFDGLEAGTIAKDVQKAKDGRWTLDERETKFKVGDVVYYWVHVVYKGLGYNLLDQQHRVTELYSRQSLMPMRVDGPSTSGNVPCLGASITKVVDDAGQFSTTTCTKQLLFEENFDTLSTDKWMIHEHFSLAPDYEFVVYRNRPENVKVENSNLRISPTLISKEHSEDFVKRGDLTLDKCTEPRESKDCHRLARGYYILPPVSSGKVTTENSFRFMYGRIEISATLPSGDWIYPLLSLEPYRSNLPLEDRVTMRVASSLGNPSLRTPQGLEIGGSLLRAGVLLNDNDKHEFLPNGNATTDGYWSSGRHLYELIWKPDELTLKVDGNIYATTSDSSRLEAVNQPMFINLAVAVGGHREFPNKAISGKQRKPWRNQGSKAVFDFFNATETWSPTWQEGKSDLQVDYVKVYAI